MRRSHRVVGVSIAVFAMCFNLAASYGRSYDPDSSASGPDYAPYSPQTLARRESGARSFYKGTEYFGRAGVAYYRGGAQGRNAPWKGPYGDDSGPYPGGPGPYPGPKEPHPGDYYGPVPGGPGPYPPKAPRPNPEGDGRGFYPGDPYKPYNPNPADPYSDPYPAPKPADPYPPTRYPTDPYPAPKPADPYPAPKPADPYPPTRYPTDPYPAPKPADPYPAPKPVDPYPPTRYPTDPYPAPKPADPYPAPKPVDPYPPTRYPTDPYPAPKPADPYPAPKPVGPYPPVKPAPKPSLPSSLCDNCKFKNGVGYNPYPKSCQAYVTCRRYDGHKLIPTKMYCPYNLFWSQKLLTCVRPKDTKCPYDPCQSSRGGGTVPVYGNCAAYHVCNKYRYTGSIYCCAYGYRYQNGYGYNKPGYPPCVRDPACKDTCAPKKTPVKKEPCRLSSVRGIITKYQELVHGEYIVRDCAPGSAFVQKDCGCTARVKIARKKGCSAEVFIDFRYGIRDTSGNQVSIGNEWNRVKSVKASVAKDGFAGEFYNGQLILWRFANAPLGPPLRINFWFLEKAYKKGGYAGKNEILVSNGDCGKPASVSITFDRASQTVTALVDTKSTYGKNYKPAYVSVPYVPGEFKEVYYSYDGKYLTLFVNSKSSQKRKSVAVHGDVQVRQCALSIGGVKGATPFYGIIDDFKLFLCIPEKVNPYPRPTYPAGSGPFPRTGPYPGPGADAGRPGPYPVPGPAPYPVPGPAPYPVPGPAPYPGAKGPYRGNPGYPTGSNSRGAVYTPPKVADPYTPYTDYHQKKPGPAQY